jgi:hemerythrin-like metal-binding protein
MGTIEWQDSYSVGDPVLDADHKVLIELINEISLAAKHGRPARPVIKRLEHYATHHFRREEERMAAVDYEDFEQHKKGHQSFIDWLERVKETYEKTDAERQIAADIGKYLQRWLTHHILEDDMKYKTRI